MYAPISIAITDAITTLAEAERRLKLSRTEDDSFFSEWQTHLPDLSSFEQTALDELRRRYLYQRSEEQLLEGTVTLLSLSTSLCQCIYTTQETFLQTRSQSG